MSFFDMPGGASAAVRRQAHADWAAGAAARAGIDLTGFDPEAPYDRRAAWAIAAGLLVACVYSRFSSKVQKSTTDQVRADVEYAAAHDMYVPPELICVDEAVKGRKDRRPGLERMKAILRTRVASVMLVFQLSRLFRRAYLGYKLVQEEVVEEGLRAVSVSQGVDTAAKGWKAQVQIYGVMDDLQLDTIADFVRAGHVGLFKAGHTVGAVGIGLKRVEVPGGRLTRRGLPRTRLGRDEDAAALVRQHAAWLLEGMPVTVGVRRWRAAGGPADPRSTTGQMSRQAYIRLMTNPRLTGRLEYGRRKNAWSTKRDGVRQIPQPDSAVTVIQFEELRILPDDVAARLVALFAGRKTGPRVSRLPGRQAVWDLVTGVFVCGRCGHRLYQGGAHGRSMRCPEPDCPARVMVNRKTAVRSVCARLAGLFAADPAFVGEVVAAAGRSATAPDDLDQRVRDVEQQIRARSNRINDLMELAGAGTDADRADVKRKTQAEMAERAGLQLELTRLKAGAAARPPVTPEAVRERLAEFGGVLEEAAEGRLGEEAVYKAVDVFTRLVGGRVVVESDARAGRKKCTVRGRFTPRLLDVVAGALGFALPPAADTKEVVVWLREPPRLDAVAPEVRRLYEDEGLGFRAIAKRLGIGCGNVYASYLRYYELQGLPVPDRRPRGRHKRSD